jgi:hypothetical protein
VTQPRGPFVRAALLCERVLCETSGTLSAIRIVHEGAILESDGAAIDLVLLLMLVRGEVPPGRHEATLRIQEPSGEVVGKKEIAFTLDDGGPEQASSLVIDVRFAPRRAGVYWFQVTWSDEARMLTQVPFTARPAGPATARAAALGPGGVLARR